MGGSPSTLESSKKGSGTDAVEAWMKSVVSNFFKKDMMSLIDTKGFGEYSLNDRKKLARAFGVRRSFVDDEFLGVLGVKFFIKAVKSQAEDIDEVNLVGVRKTSGREKLPLMNSYRKFVNKKGPKLNVFRLVADLSKGENAVLEIDKDERENFMIMIQILFNTLVIEKKKKLVFEDVILVLKFVIFFKEIYRVKKERFRYYLEENLLVNKLFILKVVKMQLDLGTIAKNQRLKIAFTITDTAASSTWFDRFQKDVLVKWGLLRLFDVFKKQKSFDFGVFHLCIKIGHAQLEWDTGSFVQTQNFEQSWSSSFSRAVFKVCDVKVSKKELRTVVDTLNSVIMKWNSGVLYSKTNSIDEKGRGYGNCHKFFLEMRKCLKDVCPGYKEDEFITRVLNSLKNQTDLSIENIYSIGTTKKFKELLEEEEEIKRCFEVIKTSDTHKEYDQNYQKFANAFRKGYKDKEFSASFPSDFRLLKGIDRGFWMRRKKCAKRINKKKGELERQKYKSYLLQKKGIDLDYRGDDNCPFHDPSLTTLQSGSLKI